MGGGGREVFLDLNREVDLIFCQLAIAERVRHARVALRDHQTAARADRFDRGREDVHLDPERHLPCARSGGVQQHDVGRAHRREQPRDKRQAHRQVVEPLAGVPHPGPDEWRLEDHPVARWQRRLRGEHEQPVALHGLLERVEQDSRCREVAAGDDPRLQCRQRGEGLLQLLLGDDSHRSMPPPTRAPSPWPRGRRAARSNPTRCHTRRRP